MQFFFKMVISLFAFTWILAYPPLSQARSFSMASVKVDVPPELDGSGEDVAWEKADSLVVEADFGPEITLSSVYTDNRLYFRFIWGDWTESVHEDKWVYKGDGWEVKQEKRWEDEPPWPANTDRFCFQWPIGKKKLIERFSKKGCAILCHKQNKEEKMHTYGPGHVSDLWQWRASITNPLGYVDDGYLDHTNLSKKEEKNTKKRINAAHKWDDHEGDLPIRNKEGNGPKWIAQDHPNGPFLVKGNEAPVEVSKVSQGDTVPGWVLARPKGSRGDIDAAAKYDKENERWVLEISRSLVTSDKEHDVQFDDLSKAYYFGIAVWENDELYGHMRVKKPIALTFEK